MQKPYLRCLCESSCKNLYSFFVHLPGLEKPSWAMKVFPCGQETKARPSNLGLSDGSRMIICFPLWLTCMSEPTVAPSPRRYGPQREV